MNWSYDGAPATHVPDTQTNQGTVTIPSGVTVTVSSATSTLSGVNIKVAGTLDIASGTSALAVQNLEVTSGGTANIQRPLTANNSLQVDNGGTATFSNVCLAIRASSHRLRLAARLISTTTILRWAAAAAAAAELLATSIFPMVRPSRQPVTAPPLQAPSRSMAQVRPSRTAPLSSLP
ncbi:hypothetical protein [Gluconobacter cerinus]|uniref:hypothetical protein n=1 Tax=Gluconobacter cerinus TaxID=38307 RepID=UPI001B8C6058|nr:hypothetical protein [Gluconobacter cerinus]MBS1038176.1 hypothetical protein [Gluconobacter cerinus]